MNPLFRKSPAFMAGVMAFLLLGHINPSISQPATTESDTQLIPSAGFSALWPDAGICKLSVSQLDDVEGSFTADHCLCRNDENTGWTGKAGTGGSGGGGTGLDADDRGILEGSVQLDSIMWSDDDLDFCTDGGRCRSISFDRIAGSQTPQQIRDALAGLQGTQRLDISAIKGVPSNTLYLGDDSLVTFQVPQTASNITLRTTGANVDVIHNIANLSGSGLAGKVTTSVVSGKSHVTIGAPGFVNVHLVDEIQIVSSTAGGAGRDGEFTYLLSQYDSTGAPVNSWVGEHTISDPITSPLNFPINLVTGLIPVDTGDYFVLQFKFSAAVSGRTLTFGLPSDNADLDEKLQFIYFPTSSVVPMGPAGPQGPAGPPGPAGSGGDGRFIALSATPTDLTPYANGQILGIDTPSPGKFLEVVGADAGELHSFQTTFEADSANPAQGSWVVGTDLNYGYSSFGDVFGELKTADGGKALTPSNTPVMRMEIEQEVATVTPNVGGNLYGFTTTYTLLIRKTDLATAPATIYARFYTGPPGNDNQVATVEFSKGSDNALHDYHTYIDRSGADINTESILSIKYFSLFRSNPPTGDQTSNPLELHEAKTTRDYNAEPAVWARLGASDSHRNY